MGVENRMDAQRNRDSNDKKTVECICMKCDSIVDVFCIVLTVELQVDI